MNKRIKELAKQAHFDEDGGHLMAHGVYVTTRLAKFAELIVKECSRVLEIKGAETGQEPYYYGASLIEEHFGVEE
jgi:hypothetical protein